MSSSDPTVGLCAGCRHARTLDTARSRFWLCSRAAWDARLERYPRLPVSDCPGHEPGAPEPQVPKRGSGRSGP